MIIGQDWAWAHVPKCGGDYTSQLIDSVEGLALRSDPRSIRAKHDSFRDRGVEGKPFLLANLRRLPDAVISRYQERAQRSPHRVPVPRADQMINSEPDCILRRFRADALPIVWLRSEHVLDDLIAALNAIVGLSDAQQQTMRSVSANKPPLTYDHNTERWFSPQQVDRLYAVNPLWAEIERRIYATGYDPAGEIVTRRDQVA